MREQLIKNYTSKVEEAFAKLNKMSEYDLANMGAQVKEYYINGIGHYAVKYNDGIVKFKATHDDTFEDIHFSEITPKYISNISEYLGLPFNLNRMCDNLAIGLGEDYENKTFPNGEEPKFKLFNIEYKLIEFHLLKDVAVIESNDGNRITVTNKYVPGTIDFYDLYWVILNNSK